ncbi:MAG: energy transducer TonB [Bacteroidia bacterium]|nr:energy transducer TonB [Bacteroidia bacterium]
MSTYAEEEARARRVSALITVLFIAGFLVVAYFWIIFRGTIPPEDENPYIIAGMIDFGYTYTVGSVQAATTPSSPSAIEPVITSPESSPVQTPLSPSTSQQTQTEQQEASETSEEAGEEEEGEVFQPGGAPDASTEGDLGSGLLEFGEGDEGTAQRRLIYFVAPRYQVQKEARVKFELYIQPDGRVSHARALDLQAPPELKRAGEEAIQQWRFNPIPRNQIQRMTVTIRFKLR